MSKIPISFQRENVLYTVVNEIFIKKWIVQIIKKEGFMLSEITIILCDDPYLLKLNQGYLEHNTHTDIITFDNSEEEKEIEGDIYISIDRVKDNATEFGIETAKELNRVIIHGVLHLLGYNDKTEVGKNSMTNKEDGYLKFYKEKFYVPRGT